MRRCCQINAFKNGMLLLVRENNGCVLGQTFPDVEGNTSHVLQYVLYPLVQLVPHHLKWLYLCSPSGVKENSAPTYLALNFGAVRSAGMLR